MEHTLTLKIQKLGWTLRNYQPLQIITAKGPYCKFRACPTVDGSRTKWIIRKWTLNNDGTWKDHGTIRECRNSAEVMIWMELVSGQQFPA